MRARRRWILLVVGVLLALGGLAAAGRSVWLRASDDRPVEAYNPVINPADFVDRVDNPYFPLRPGTRYVYTGQEEGEAERDERVVTGETKVILGVRCVVVQDTVTVEGQLRERTLDWYAQDRAGNVWYFGESVENYKNGKVVDTEGSWEAGVDGAKPGIIMKGQPNVNDAYREEYYPREAEDMAQVLSRDESLAVPYGRFERVVLIKEWSPLERGVEEHKYYAPNVGLIRDVMVKGGEEEIVLVEVRSD
ncbi:MAG: hypothetical protein IRY97_12505 [Thermomicrobiaceae bacterium]|nr:hypothetical protein [Thermomicrobiaceae bacterium]